MFLAGNGLTRRPLSRNRYAVADMIKYTWTIARAPGRQACLNLTTRFTGFGEHNRP
jgi:hypothetical protein